MTGGLRCWRSRGALGRLATAGRRFSCRRACAGHRRRSCRRRGRAGLCGGRPEQYPPAEGQQRDDERQPRNRRSLPPGNRRRLLADGDDRLFLRQGRGRRVHVGRRKESDRARLADPGDRGRREVSFGQTEEVECAVLAPLFVRLVLGSERAQRGRPDRIIRCGRGALVATGSHTTSGSAHPRLFNGRKSTGVYPISTHKTIDSRSATTAASHREPSRPYTGTLVGRRTLRRTADTPLILASFQLKRCASSQSPAVCACAGRAVSVGPGGPRVFEGELRPAPVRRRSSAGLGAESERFPPWTHPMAQKPGSACRRRPGQV